MLLACGLLSAYLLATPVLLVCCRHPTHLSLNYLLRSLTEHCGAVRAIDTPGCVGVVPGYFWRVDIIHKVISASSLMCEVRFSATAHTRKLG